MARSDFGHDTTTSEVLAGVDLTGQLALVTGGSSGLGVETARALAAHGAEVVITARNLEKAEAVAKKIREETSARVSVEQLELDRLASVRAFATRFLERNPKLQLLINNAGVMACPKGETSDGFEQQFGTNHLGHFLLTGLLVPALLAGAPARIVNLSSRGHFISPLNLEDPNFEQRDYDKWVAYGQAKTANVLHAVELERRLGARGVHAYAVHPGVIITELIRHMDQEDFEGFRKRGTTSRMKTVEAGAATTVYAATAPELAERGGCYLEDCHVSEVNDDPTATAGVRSYAVDPQLAQRLWAESERLVAERFTF
ncbi:MAG: SDR family NAD(P)-dependent oxidoreductase [Polyangiaceae bacterium]|nr:SDR family NAD(P)-dependent oxidoreductase [Myxococcales bacterium]MCB9586213.1 SDR family NAD(P)-dependent oxidoreductase [Polyangiaceae bacterium]MCB9606890.1 SDR family NAD(P)-dependent oxidoreductase [Polyangiaceae bacterium]